jgi:hypothetical protein
MAHCQNNHNILENDSLNHSFSKIEERDGVSIYYTCPANLTQVYDSDIILAHYETLLSNLGNDKQWIWIFDSKEFGLKQSLEIHSPSANASGVPSRPNAVGYGSLQTAIGIAKLISPQKYGKNLQQIVIANPTMYIRTTLNIILPFLSQDIRNKIVFYKKLNQK